ncbi:response regulator transcription factor [Lacinutrix chionoecetis]
MKRESNNEPLENDDAPDIEEAFTLLARNYRFISGNKSTLSQIKQDIITQQIPVLKNFTNGLGTCALSVFDIEEKKFLYVEDAIEEVTGISKQTYLNRGIKYLFSRVSYDNIPALISSTFHERKFLSKINVEEYSHYIINREYSYRNKNSRRWVLQQTIKHLVNAQGEIFAIVTLETNIDHLKFDGKFRYYIYNRKLNKIVHPKRPNEINVTLNVLSDREKEIIELLALGWTNQMVADKLSISFHTVRTHRKNIFKKLDCKNIVELLHIIK